MAQKLLVPVDGSDNATRAAGFAASLAESSPGTEVTLLYVGSGADLPPPPASPPGSRARSGKPPCAPTPRKPCAGRRSPLRPARVRPDTLVKMGDPAKTIVAVAGEGGYTQIVMGTRGLGGAGGLVLGSVSHKVIALAGIPVTVVK